MSREQLLEITRHKANNLKNKRIDLAPEILKVPTSAYADPNRFNERPEEEWTNDEMVTRA